MRAILKIFALALVVVMAVAGYRTANFPSRQLVAPPGDVPLLDELQAASWLAGAITYPTVSRQDGLTDFAAFRGLEVYLQETFPAAHAALEVTMISDYGRLYFWRGSQPALDAMLFAAHLDVVPVPDSDLPSWQQAPFAGTIADGYIWGRGTMDDKGNAVAMLAAIDGLATAGYRPARSVLIAFGYDEEVGGREGAAKISAYLDDNKIQLYAALDEGLAVTTGLTPGIAQPTAMIGVSERGYVSLRLTSHAQGGHSAMPPPHTAIGTLASVIDRIHQAESEAKIDGPVARMFEWLGPEMPTLQRFVFANLWLFEPLVLRQLTASTSGNALVRSTAAPTMFEAGIKENVLPTTAEAIVNFRLAPGDSIDALLARVHDVIGPAQIDVATTTGIVAEPSPEASVEAAFFKQLQLTIAQVFPDALVAPGLVLGATDGRYYTRNTPNVYRFSPMRLTGTDLKRLHGIDERLSTADFVEMIRFYHRLLVNTTT